MKVIYNSTIVEIGSQVEIFIKEKMLILFNDTALPELKDISVVHEQRELQQDIEVGDELVLGSTVFKVTSLGGKVNETMRELGHSTIVFNGALSSDLPGTICVEDAPIPTLAIHSKLHFRRPSKEEEMC